MGDEAEVVVDQVVHQQGHQNVRDEVRQEHDALRQLLVSLAGHFIQHDGECQLQDIAADDKGQVVQHRVLQQQAQLAGDEEELEVLQSHKGAGKNTLVVLEVREGDVGAGHGQVGKDEEEQDGRKAHQDQRLVLHKGTAHGRLAVIDHLLLRGFLQVTHSFSFVPVSVWSGS